MAENSIGWTSGAGKDGATAELGTGKDGQPVFQLGAGKDGEHQIELEAGG
jgi:hypothetical protein